MMRPTYGVNRVIRWRGFYLAMLLAVAAVAAPLAAQQLPQQPNAVRQQLSQAGAPVQPKPAPAPTARPAAAQASPAGAPQARPAAPRRDPFDPLVSKDKGPAIPANLPPGKAGLMIATLNINGIVRGPGGMIAIVSNPQMRVYFLHQGDQLYDGQVGTITLEAVSFHQTGRDPFGAVIERDLTRRLYPSPGEQP